MKDRWLQPLKQANNTKTIFCQLLIIKKREPLAFILEIEMVKLRSFGIDTTNKGTETQVASGLL